MNIKFGNCFLGKTLVLDDGVSEITVTLDVGPRIIGFRKVGGFNMMFEDVSDSVSHDCSSVYGKGAKWHIYGGHRLWLSPEDESTYYPDNNPVSYEINGNSATFTPGPWKVVNVLPSLTVTLCGKDGVTVTHRVKNLGEKRNLCIWALTVMKSGGTLTVPLSAEDTGYLANRNIVMWHYCSFNDKRLSLADDKITLKSDIGIPNPFKLGTYCKNLKAMYALEENGVRQVFTKTAEVGTNGNYPDFCCNLETYCSHIIHEVETLSSIKEVDSFEEIVHTEKWELR